MKTAAQVFIIIGMVFGCWMILPLIFGGIALSQMSKGQRPSTGISVCVLLFCNMIGGILLLCAKDEDFYKPGTNYGYNPNMNNGYNPNMNNGYNPNMNNGYNANMNNNAYNPNANTGYSNANYATPVNNTTAYTYKSAAVFTAAEIIVIYSLLSCRPSPSRTALSYPRS